MHRASPRPASPRRPPRDEQTGAGRAGSCRCGWSNPITGAAAQRSEYVLPSGTHRLCLAVWGPTPGIEDGEVAAGDDPATPRWAWIRGRGFAGAGGGLGSPGEAKWPVRWNYAPHPPLFALVAGFLCSLSQSSFPLLATPSFLQRFLLSGCRLFAPVSPFSLSYPGFCLTNPV